MWLYNVEESWRCDSIVEEEEEEANDEEEEEEEEGEIDRAAFAPEIRLSDLSNSSFSFFSNFSFSNFFFFPFPFFQHLPHLFPFSSSQFFLSLLPCHQDRRLQLQ